MSVQNILLFPLRMRRLLLFFFMFLSSCSTQIPQAPHQTLLKQAWCADGMFAYQENGKGFSAAYLWKNATKNYEIQLIGPLGAWRAKLSGDAHDAQLAMSDGKILRAKNPEVLMRENLGWSIPVINLQHWIMALTNPAYPSLVLRDRYANVFQIQQLDWTMDYSQYKNFLGTYLPERILLTQGNKKITVVVEHFSRGGECE